jgi:hypothetical protein
MNKHLISIVVATSVVAAVSLAYAQTTGAPAAGASSPDAQSQPAPMGSSTPSAPVGSSTQSVPMDSSTQPASRTGGTMDAPGSRPMGSTTGATPSSTGTTGTVMGTERAERADRN